MNILSPEAILEFASQLETSKTNLLEKRSQLKFRLQKGELTLNELDFRLERIQQTIENLEYFAGLQTSKQHVNINTVDHVDNDE
jgi:hypothetical protein